MGTQEKIFVIGHKNPDTDSICSAIAYADIKNQKSLVKKYIPKRAGQINEETQYVLKRFGVQPPAYLGNIGTQVKDMDIRVSPEADKSMSLKNAWDMMQENSIVSLPIRDKDGELEGLVTIGDIAKTYMDTTDSYFLSNARTQYRRIAETLSGKVVEGNEHAYFVKGKVLVGTANPQVLKEFVKEDDMVIMGNREEDHIQAIRLNVSCIIVGMGVEVSQKVLSLAHEKNIVVITSPCDSFTIARLINQSIPLRFVMKRDNLVTFNTEDFTDDIQDVMIKHRHRAFPVINKRGKCVGTCARIGGDFGQRGEGVHGGDVENARVLLAQHILGEHLGGNQGAQEIQVEDELHTGGLQVEKGGDVLLHVAVEVVFVGGGGAGIVASRPVHQDVAGAEIPADLFPGLQQGFLFQDVGGIRLGRAALGGDVGGKFGGGFQVEIQQGHLGAAPGDGFGEQAAQHAARAGYHRDFVF